MNTVFSNDTPIYIQVVDLLSVEILCGKYPIGSRFPSVRELAEFFKINPNTCQKSLSELERMGLLISLGTQGRVVTNDENLLRNQRKFLVHKNVEEFLSKMNALGIQSDEVIEYILEMRDNNGNS